jgi:hypothetical protein
VFERIAYSNGASISSRVWDYLTRYPLLAHFSDVDCMAIMREEMRDMLVGDVPMFEANVFGGGLRSRLDGAVIANLAPAAAAARALWGVGVERGLRAMSHAEFVGLLSGEPIELREIGEVVDSE